MENLTFDAEELYQEVKARALDEGAFTHEEWSGLVDDVLYGHEEFGEVHDDEELSAVKETLKSRFEEFKSDIPRT
jgi:hypothetical protein